MLLRTQAGVFRPICDFRGNVLALLDESGDIAESYRYDGFGRMRVFDGTSAEITASAVGNPFGFACKRYDPTTALCHFGARWYDPALGRFLSPDPLGFVDGPNRYAYCAGDPVNFVDPWGLCGEKGYYRVEAPVVGPFGNYYPNRPTWYSRPLADVYNGLANLLNLGLLPTEPWRRFDRYAYETWDWYERSTDWLESDQALFAYLAFPEAGAGMAWRNAGYLAESVSALARAGWARWLPQVGGVAPKSGPRQLEFPFGERMSRAEEFYRAAGWDDARIGAHMRGIDFDQAVDVVTIPKGTQLVQYQIPGAKTGNYFAPVGTPGSQLGIYTGGRNPTVFTATQDVSVLRSTAGAVVDDWSVPGLRIRTDGGGTQFFAPDPSLFKAAP